MKIYRNENKNIAEKLQKALLANGGYCPCRIDRSDDNLCMCEEFRQQIADPDFEGFCHCMLYYKEK